MKKIILVISFLLIIVTIQAQEKMYQKNGYKKVTGKENTKGERIGVWKYYNYQDILYDEIFYKKGKMRKRKRYFKSGELQQKISYDKSEKKHGKYRMYNKAKEIVVYGKYKHGKRVGKWKFKKGNGELFSITKYKKGKVIYR